MAINYKMGCCQYKRDSEEIIHHIVESSLYSKENEFDDFADLSLSSHRSSVIREAFLSRTCVESGIISERSTNFSSNKLEIEFAFLEKIRQKAPKFLI